MNVPTILTPKPLKEVLEEEENGQKIFLSERGGTYLKEILRLDEESIKKRERPPSSVRILIGSEGGWTEKEEHDILDHGYMAISLGSQTLRAETAAISCLVLINHFWNL
jgi:16S rRNA (uracil1498-N3)-methyltransferase